MSTPKRDMYRLYKNKVRIYFPKGGSFTITKEEFKKRGIDLLKSKGMLDYVVSEFYGTIIRDPDF